MSGAVIREGNYVLGLRVGVASIGWSALTLDAEDRPAAILAMGVRKFPVGAAGDVASGRETGHNQRRQEARQTRVRLARRVGRLRAVWRQLQAGGLLPVGVFKDRHAILAALDGGEPLRPYRLRTEGLDRALAPYELGRAVYHIAQRRGFQSNRRAPVKDGEELGVIKAAIAELEAAMRESGSRTLGEYLYKVPTTGARRRRWTARAMYQSEFDAIVAAQRAHHPDVLTAGFIKALGHAVFFQRPLRSQSHKIGRCDLEPLRRRTQVAGLDAQELRVLCRVNDLRLVDDAGAKEVELTGEQRLQLLKLLEGGDATFPAVRKVLGLGRSVRFNAERVDDEKLIGFRTRGRLRAAIGDVWDRLGDTEQRALVDDLCNIDDDAGLRRRLGKRFPAETVEQLLAVALEPGCASLSHKAIAKLLPRLRAGVAYATARKEYYPDADKHDVVTFLPLVQECYPHLSNPLVCRSLSELRVLINHIIKRYGRPHAIRVSLMRELRIGRKARERAAIAMRRRNKERAKVAARLLEDLGVREPPRWMVDKVLLAEECGWVDPYYGKPISIRNLIGEGAQFEMVHILPLHQSLDDSFENKTLCHVSGITGNRSVEPKALRQVKTLERFEKFSGPYAKEKLRRAKLTPEEIVEQLTGEVLASRFVDACYTSKVAVDYLSRLYPSSRVCVTTTRGPITSLVREACGLSKLELPHGSHRQAALDAAAVALSGPGIVRRLTAAALGALPGKRRLDPAVVLPWPNFAQDVQERLDGMIVSARVRKKVSGPLHEETFYRLDGEIDGKPIYSVKKHLWQLTVSDVPLIVSANSRAVVEQALAALGQPDPRRAFADANHLPIVRDRPMRAVRIRRTNDLFTIGKKKHKRHVASERNHHAATLMRAGRGGRPMADRIVVSQFEAQTRLAARSAVVVYQPDACKGLRSLSTTETLICPWLSGANAYQTIRCVSKDPSIVLTTSDDARTLAEINSDKARIRMSVEQLRLKGARKVVILPLGDVRRDNT